MHEPGSADDEHASAPIIPAEPVAPPLPAPAAAPLAESPPPRPRLWPAFAAFGASLAGSIWAGLATVAVFGVLYGMRSRGAPPPPGYFVSPPAMLHMLALGTAASAAVAIGAAALSPEGLRPRLALVFPRLGAGAIALTTLGAAGLGRAFDELYTRLHVESAGPAKLLGEMVRAANRPEGGGTALLVGTILVVGLAAPVGEELLYRGFIQGRLVRRFGAWPGILVTAGLFALAHFDKIQSAFALVLGVFLGWLTLRAGSILPAILAHALNNLWAVVDVKIDALHPWVHPGTLAVGLAALAVSVWSLRPAVRRPADPPAVPAP